METFGDVGKVVVVMVVVANLLVCPDLVGPHVGGVEVLFGFVKDHAVDGGVVLVRVVLDVLFQAAFLVNREDVSVACKVVERVAIDVVGRLVGSKNKDGTSLGSSIVGFGVATH